jgi:hypothetical protein
VARRKSLRFGFLLARGPAGVRRAEDPGSLQRVAGPPGGCVALNRSGQAIDACFLNAAGRLLLQTSDAHHEEFIEVGADDREKLYSLQERIFAVRVCSSTLFWNSNKLSSRLIYNSRDSMVRVGGSGEASGDRAVTGVATSVTFFVSSESDLPAGEVCISPYFTWFQREGTRIILIQCLQYAFPKQKEFHPFVSARPPCRRCHRRNAGIDPMLS